MWGAAVAMCGLALMATFTGTASADATVTGAVPLARSAPAVARPAHSVTPEQFGARGNGVTDDTVALQRAFDDAGSATVYLTPGRVYVHTQVLHLRTPGLHVTGAGVLLATVESQSSVWLQADNVRLDGGVIVRTAHTTKRWTAWEQMGLRIFGHSGITVSHVRIEGAAAAGLYVGNAAHNFTLDHVTVANSRADGIHMTMGSYRGRVIAPTIINSGDDAVAVVSYSADGTPCHDITVSSPTVLGTSWGRGLSVVGGTNITETNIDVQRTSAAGVYVAAEGAPWFTAAPRNVLISGGKIVAANTGTARGMTAPDHGAVLVMSGENGPAPTNVTITGLAISRTRTTASRNFGVVTYGGDPTGILFSNLTVTGGPANAYGGNAEASSYRIRNVRLNGLLIPNHG
jgi:polygalacturonase